MRMRWIIYVFVVGLANIYFSPRSTAQCVEGNCTNGEGIYIYPSGAKFVGNFLNHLAHGFGILYFANGDIYEGMWNQHIRQGKGKLISKDNYTYTGEFENNKFHGTGKIEFSNTDNYTGNFVDGVFHGSGIYVASSGQRFEGSWINGNPDSQSDQWQKLQQSKLIDHEESPPRKNCNLNYCHNEQGLFTYQDGTIYAGDFMQGSPEGNGRVEYINGDVYEGGWRNHAPEGMGIVNYQSGRSYGAIWQNGIPIEEIRAENELREELVAIDESEETKIWAVIIGVSRYNHMPSLKYTDDDAFHLYAFLKSPQGGALPDDQIALLIDEQGNREGIIENIQKTLLRADTNDVVLLYFSGHGLPGRIIPNDFDGFYNAVEYREITSLLDKSRARHKILIADACHSGSLIASKSPLSRQLQDFYNELAAARDGVAMITSSKGEEVSMESTGLRHGIFSHFLIEGLGGAADLNRDQVITISELYKYISNAVSVYTQGAQNPMISGNYDANMPIGFVRMTPG